MSRSVWLLIVSALFLSACEITSSGLEEDGPAESGLVLPAHTGPYKVGTTQLFVVDQDRDDEYTPEADTRQLVVTLFYPADQEGFGMVQYMHPTVVDLLAATQDYAPPAEIVEKFSHVESRLTAGAPVTSAISRLPVVFWSHGLGGVASLYTTFAADLASQGYLVVAIDHTYGAFASIFPNGSIKSIKVGSNAPPFPTVVSIWARDMASVLDHLEVLDDRDPSGLLTGRVDLTRVGATGHSTGGSAAAEVLTFDDRFKAAVTLDAPQVGPAAEGPGVDDPIMLFFADPSEYLSGAVESRLRAPGFSLTVTATTHYSFTDLPVLLELADIPVEARNASGRPPGTIDPFRNLEIINAWSLAFFDRYLRGRAAPLLDSSQGAYPEVTARRIGVVGQVGS